MSCEDIAEKLKQVYKYYDNVRIGIAGSYANNTQQNNSDIDVVLDGDSTRAEIMDYIRGLFDIKVDVLWLELLRQDDEEMDLFAVSNELPINNYSVYKTVMKEVRWI